MQTTMDGVGESRLIDAHVSMRDRHDYYSLQLKKKKHVIYKLQTWYRLRSIPRLNFSYFWPLSRVYRDFEFLMTMLCLWKAEMLNCVYYIGSSTMMIGRKETRLDENDPSQW